MIAASVAGFATAWAAIGVQLASGHDSALASKSQSTAKTSSSHKRSTTVSSAAPTNTAQQTSSASSSSGSSQPLAPVTTQQS